MEQRHNTYSKISHLAAGLSSACILITLGLVTISSIKRWLGFGGILGTDEIAGYLLVVIVYFGLAYTFEKDGFVRVELLYQRFRGRFKQLVDIFIHLISLAYWLLLLYYGWELAKTSFHGNVRSVGLLTFPLYIPQGAVVLGLLILIVAMLSKTISLVTSPFFRKHLSASPARQQSLVTEE